MTFISVAVQFFLQLQPAIVMIVGMVTQPSKGASGSMFLQPCNGILGLLSCRDRELSNPSVKAVLPCTKDETRQLVHSEKQPGLGSCPSSKVYFNTFIWCLFTDFFFLFFIMNSSTSTGGTDASASSLRVTQNSFHENSLKLPLLPSQEAEVWNLSCGRRNWGLFLSTDPIEKETHRPLKRQTCTVLSVLPKEIRPRPSGEVQSCVLGIGQVIYSGIWCILKRTCK